MQLRAIHYATQTPVSINIEHGTIQSIDPLPASESNNLPTIAPGLIDLQINGYAGLDINALPIPDQTLSQLIRALWREGVTSCFPTVITNTPQAITAAMQTIARSCDNDPIANQGVAGIHLEGPFISPHDGPRGAHAREHVQPPNWDLFQQWQDAAAGRIRIITLSPEWPGSNDFIARCAQTGVTVSIGHTSATPDQIAQAVQAGARLSTHLGNAAHLMLPRHPNYVWEQLAQDDLWTTLIADGFHLPDQVLKVILKVKSDRAMLISDAVSLSGMPPGPYTTPVGGHVVLTPQGRLHLAENDQFLAGSAQTLLHGIAHLTARNLTPFPSAWNMASLRPAAFMRLSTAAGITPGAPADLVLFHRAAHHINLIATYKAGQAVYSK